MKPFQTFFYFLFFIFYSYTSFAQTIAITKDGNPLLKNIPYSTSFIASHKIKNITIAISSKADNQPIIDKGLVEFYSFNETGLPTYYYYTFIQKTEETETIIPAVYRKGKKIRSEYIKTNYKYIYDTVFTFFYYDKRNQLTGKRTSGEPFYNSYYYDYDSIGRITKEIHCKETNKRSKTHFQLGIQQGISQEQFQYLSPSAAQQQIKCLNDEGREYKKITLQLDNQKNIIEQNEEFTVGWTRTKELFKYDAANRILEKSYSSNTTGDLEESASFEYDQNANLFSEKIFKNKILLQEISFLYDEKKTFISSEISHYFFESNIGIERYSYEFY